MCNRETLGLRYSAVGMGKTIMTDLSRNEKMKNEKKMSAR